MKNWITSACEIWLARAKADNVSGMVSEELTDLFGHQLDAVRIRSAGFGLRRSGMHQPFRISLPGPACLRGNEARVKRATRSRGNRARWQNGRAIAHSRRS